MVGLSGVGPADCVMRACMCVQCVNHNRFMWSDWWFKPCVNQSFHVV